MNTKRMNGVINRLNGRKSSILTAIGGILTFVFISGGAWYQLNDHVGFIGHKLNSHVQEAKEKYVERRELQLTLEPLKQNIQNINKSLDDIKTIQETQNEKVLQELRRINSGH